MKVIFNFCLYICNNIDCSRKTLIWTVCSIRGIYDNRRYLNLTFYLKLVDLQKDAVSAASLMMSIRSKVRQGHQ